MRLNRIVVLLVFLLVIVSPEALSGDAAKFRESDYWMGIYFKKTKIGYAHITAGRTKPGARGVFTRVDDLYTEQAAQGRKAVCHGTYTFLSDDVYYPIMAMSRVDGDLSAPGQPRSSGWVAMTSSYGTDFVMEKLTMNAKDVSEGKEALSADDIVALKTGSAYNFGIKELALGQVFRAYRFRWRILVEEGDSSGLNAKIGGGSSRADLRVLRRERITVGDKTYDTLVVSEQVLNHGVPDYEILEWRTLTGELIKEEMPRDKITWIREPKAKAMEIGEDKTANKDRGMQGLLRRGLDIPASEALATSRKAAGTGYRADSPGIGPNRTRGHS